MKKRIATLVAGLGLAGVLAPLGTAAHAEGELCIIDAGPAGSICIWEPL